MRSQDAVTGVASNGCAVLHGELIVFDPAHQDVRFKPANFYMNEYQVTSGGISVYVSAEELAQILFPETGRNA